MTDKHENPEKVKSSPPVAEPVKVQNPPDDAGDEKPSQSEKPVASLDAVIKETISDVAQATTSPQPVTPQPEAEAPKKRKRGRPRKHPKTDDSAPPKPEALAGVPQMPSQQDAQITACANICVMMTNTSGIVLAGGEAGMMTDDEKLLAQGGYEAYLKAKGVDSVPAWAILAGSLAPYYMRVMQTENAKIKVSTFMVSAWMRLKNLFKRKKSYARPDIGNNDERQNDTSEKAGKGKLFTKS